jgi:tetratricopeptide (TPR) repeat protein
LLELVRAAHATGGIDGLPTSIEGMVVADIDRLPLALRKALRRASVLGMTFEEELVSTLYADDEQQPGRKTWVALAEYLVPAGGGSWRFRHALIRDAAYEGLPFRTRRALHALAGEAIEQRADAATEEDSELLSLHFFHAHRFGEAWRHSLAAAGRAEAKYAIVEAAGFYERALTASRSVEDIQAAELAATQESLGDLYERLGHYDRSAAAFTAARKLIPGDVAGLARLFYKHSTLADRNGQYSEALRWLRRGMTLLEGHGGPEVARQRARLVVFYGLIRAAQARRQEALRWLHDGIREAQHAGEQEALAHAYFILDWVLVELGRSNEAVYSERALAIYEELGLLGPQATIWNNLGVFAGWEGRWDEAVELYDKARQIRLTLGDSVDAALGTLNIAEVLSDQGHLRAAEEMLKDALRVFKAAEWEYMIANTTITLARVACRDGRYEEALEWYGQAREQYGSMGAEAELLETDARSAECLVLQRRVDEALAVASIGLARAKALGGTQQQVLLHRVCGYGHAQAGRLPDARASLTASLSAARSRNASYDIALALDGLARVARLEGHEDVDASRESAEILSRLGVVAFPEVPLGA